MQVSDEQRWALDAVLADGSVIHLRPIRLEDAPALRRFHAGLSPESQYRRFFTPHPVLSEKEAEHFANVDHVDREAFVAVRDGAIVAVGRYDRAGLDAAEVAFTVSDSLQGLGIGTLLLEYVAAAARERHINKLVADTLMDNHPMLQVFRDSGYRETSVPEKGVVRVSLDISDNSAFASLSEQREWRAVVRSMERLLRPSSVAVIGAGRSGGVGHTVVANLLAGGFTGSIHPVNVNEGTVLGIPIVRSVEDIGLDVDLAVVCVPAADALAAVASCARKGVRGLVVISSGFAEAGPDGAELQSRLVAIAHEGGMRLIGPNCLGVITTDPAVRLNATFASQRPKPGRVAFASQSGALGVALLERASSQGLGISSFVSLGNKADVSGNDLLRYWADDPTTDVILLYLESFGNARMFSRIARHVSKRKPIVVIKGGRRAAGARAAASHTAAMTSSDIAADALFHQCGVIRVTTLEEFLDVASVLRHQPLPHGRRVAVMVNAGGAGILAADALEDANMMLPVLDDAMSKTIRSLVPKAAGTRNPVDLGAECTTEQMAAVATELTASNDIDAVLAVTAPVAGMDVTAVAAALRGVRDAQHKPVLLCSLGATSAGSSEDESGLFAFPESSASALATVATYAEWRHQPDSAVAVFDDVDRRRARQLIESALRGSPGGRWLSGDEIDALLEAYGLPRLRETVVTGGAAAVEAARDVGFPVALKALGPMIVHKTDAGGVRLNIAGEEEVLRIVDELQRIFGEKMTQIMVQQMAPPGVEMLIGMTEDRDFGPILVAGAGGITAEVLNDRAVRLLPLTQDEAREMLSGLRVWTLLEGYRGAPRADIEGVLDVLQRVAAMAEDLAEIAELDLNPLIATPGACWVVDARVRVRPVPVGLPSVRHLRVAQPLS